MQSECDATSDSMNEKRLNPLSAKIQIEIISCCM